ncbi:MAG: hypothetical protein HY789_09480 [Deltaproteobacteria bacterium]|nr:hypothetical protein [Deltaproteobacteria bacterium]
MQYTLEEGYPLKALVEKLFGNRAWLEIKHATSLPRWKKYAERILSAIETSAKATIEIADNEWFEELSKLINHGKTRIKTSKNTEQLFANLSASLAEVSFFQIGQVPDHSRFKQTTLRHPGNWKLDSFRSVQYVQNCKQAEAKERYKKTLKVNQPVGNKE